MTAEPTIDVAPIVPDIISWYEALEYVARHYSVPFSSGGAKQLADALLAVEAGDPVSKLATKFGLNIKQVKPSLELVTSWRLPIILQFVDGAVGVVITISTDKNASVVFSGDGGCVTVLPVGILIDHSEFVVIARPLRAMPDERIDKYIAPYKEHWFRNIAFRDMRYYVNVMLASFVSNVLALAGVVFSMQVYDRVVPSKSLTTLYVLFLGVALAAIFDFFLRRLRTSIIDIIGKRTDLHVSDLAFGHALRVKNSARPTSTGTFIAQLRDLEQIRELLTSATVSAFADLPFFVLFLFIFWLIGGPLVLVPAVAVIMLIVPSILMQGKLRKTASEAMRESSLRNAMLVEAVQGIEDVKSLQAEDYFQQKWNQHNAASAQVQLRLRSLTNGLTAWSQTVQTGTFAAVVVIGAPLVINGDLTTGALVACSILGSRMMAPMAQLTQVLGRYQQARVGLDSINSILKLPTDHPETDIRISAPVIKGEFHIKQAAFSYSEKTGKPALTVSDLKIMPGEKVAILGKNGAGKSTLLMALAGMIEPTSGEVLVDNLSLQQVDPSDVRKNISILTQDSRLFHGTIRENLAMGVPQITDLQLLNALNMSGASDFIRKLERGLDHTILEGGRGLSGGQKQSLLLTRLLLRDPNVLLLDEPTTAMDEVSEREFISHFQSWSNDRTVIVATHRMRVLDLVDRVIVVDKGQITKDGLKQKVLMELNGRPKTAHARPVRQSPINKMIANG